MIMRAMKYTAAAIALSVVLTGCQRTAETSSSGPTDADTAAYKVGKAAHEAANKTKEATKKAGEKIKEAADSAKEGWKDGKQK